jgi:predicted phosphodiesterase
LKIGLVTDVHYADRPDAGSRCYRDSLPKMRAAVAGMRNANVDLLVHLGDLIDNPEVFDPEVETGYLKTMVETMAPAAKERYACLGNHCVSAFSKGHFLKEFGQRKSFLSIDRNGIHLIFLDACFRPDNTDYDAGNFDWKKSHVPAAQRAWLAKDLASTRLPILVFCHQRLDEPSDLRYAAEGRREVRELLAKHKVKGVFQGHNHVNDLQTHGGVRYLTLQAMVEGKASETNAWSILDVNASGEWKLNGFGAHTQHRAASKSRS